MLNEIALQQFRDELMRSIVGMLQDNDDAKQVIARFEEEQDVALEVQISVGFLIRGRGALEQPEPARTEAERFEATRFTVKDQDFLTALRIRLD